MKFKLFIVLFLSFILTGCGCENDNIQNNNNNQTNKGESYDIYYVKTDFNTNETQLIKVNTDKLEKEVVFSNVDYFSSVIDDDNTYVISNNLIGYIKDNKINFLMGEGSYVSRYLVNDDYIYYGKDNSNASDNYFERLAIMNTDGTNSRDLHESGIGQLVVDDYIYFKPNSGSEVSKLLRYDLDGSNKMVIFDKSVGYLINEDDYLYFVNYGDNNSIYQMKIDGTEPQKIVEGPISFNYSIPNQFNGYYSMAVINNVLYYIKTSYENKLYKVDNGIETKVSDESFASIQAEDDNLFVIYQNKTGIYMLDKDGKELKTITTDFMSEYYIK